MTRTTRCLCALLFVILCGQGLVARAQPVVAQATGSEHAGRLVLHFAALPDYRLSVEGRLRVLRFSTPLETADDLAPLAARLSDWVSSLWSAYDTLSLELRPGVRMSVRAGDRSLVLEFTRETAAEGTRTDALERARGMLWLESGQAWRARDHFAALAERFPRKVTAWLDLAVAEERLGRWRRALRALERARALAPDDVTVARARTRLARAHGSRVRAGLAGLGVGDDERYGIARLRARLATASGWRMEVDERVLEADLDLAVRRPDGSARGYRGRRHELAVHAGQAWDRVVQRFSLFGGTGRPGAGWRLEVPGDAGRTRLALEYRRPWYEALEAIAAGGARDRVLLEHRRELQQPRLALRLALSSNRYGIGDRDTAARGLRAEAGLRHHFSSDGLGLSLGYAFDGERISDRALGVDGGGNRFVLLPLENRAQHTFDLAWNGRLRGGAGIGIQAGIDLDPARDARAPFGRLHIDSDMTRAFRFGLEAYTGLSSYRGDEKRFLYLGGYLRWSIGS